MPQEYVHHYPFTIPDSTTMGDLKDQISALGSSNNFANYSCSFRMLEPAGENKIIFYSTDVQDCIKFGLTNPWTPSVDSGEATSRIFSQPYGPNTTADSA